LSRQSEKAESTGLHSGGNLNFIKIREGGVVL